jgi:hypothetical protein
VPLASLDNERSVSRFDTLKYPVQNREMPVTDLTSHMDWDNFRHYPRNSNLPRMRLQNRQLHLIGDFWRTLTG